MIDLTARISRSSGQNIKHCAEHQDDQLPAGKRLEPAGQSLWHGCLRDGQERNAYSFLPSPPLGYDFINVLLSLPISIYNAMYLEGGPEASLYFSANDLQVERWSLYRRWRKRHVRRGRPVPNVIGSSGNDQGGFTYSTRFVLVKAEGACSRMDVAQPLELITVGFLGSLAAGLATGLGLSNFFVKKAPPKLLDGLLGFSAGLCWAPPPSAWFYPPSRRRSLVASFGFILAHFSGRRKPVHSSCSFYVRPGKLPTSLARVWLFVLAITLHNFPEGMSVGVGFEQEQGEGMALAMAWFPKHAEGLAVALALLRQGYHPGRAVGYAH